MPNFWTKTSQYFSEKFSGARTQDEDFENICKKITDTEKGLSQLKTCLQNVITYTQNFSKYFQDINEAFRLIYDQTPYYGFTEEILCKHQIIQSEIEQFNKKINKLFLKTSEWNGIFDDARVKIGEKEEKRKVYDHYEAKLSKLTKGGVWRTKGEKYIGRNEAKYSKAASEYVEISENAFETINNSLKLTWELTNPIVSDIVNTEKELFDGISLSLNCFKDNKERFSEIKNSLYNPNSKKDTFTYDPVKFMNEKDLIKRVSVSRNIAEGPYNSGGRNSIGELLSKGKRDTTSLISRNKTINNSEGGYGTENFSNIYTNLRMTNSFGKINNIKLEEFLEIEDEFS